MTEQIFPNPKVIPNPALTAILNSVNYQLHKANLFMCTKSWNHIKSIWVGSRTSQRFIWEDMNWMNVIYGTQVVIDEEVKYGLWELRRGTVTLATGPLEIKYDEEQE